MRREGGVEGIVVGRGGTAVWFTLAFSRNYGITCASYFTMNFITAGFVLFLLPVLCIGWSLRRYSEVYKWYLLIINLVFYSLTGFVNLAFLFFIAFVNWGGVRLMVGRAGRTRFLLVTFTVVIHIFLLAFFKYYETAVLGLINLLGPSAECLLIPRLAELILPIGLSFYSFQGLSYTIDHYRDTALTPRSYADVLCYLSFFPTVMSGPIMRENHFFPQVGTYRAEADDFPVGASLILSGLFKKVVLATYLQSHLVDAVFAGPDDFSSAAVLMAVYAYTVQIYCDFSGYTDIAMGVARLMGFRIPKNFDAPYRSLNLQEFWHRWHISLSTWLRDYLYIPLGGNRRGNRYVNLFITMLLGGIWHGSSLGFLVWGGLHGLGLVIVHAWHRLTSGQQPESRILRGISGFAGWFLTLHTVALLWVFFRADSLSDSFAVLRRVSECSPEGTGFSAAVLLATVWGLTLAFCGGHLFRAFVRGIGFLPWPLRGASVGLVVALIMNLGPDGVLPFIYTRF